MIKGLKIKFVKGLKTEPCPSKSIEKNKNELNTEEKKEDLEILFDKLDEKEAILKSHKNIDVDGLSISDCGSEIKCLKGSAPKNLELPELKSRSRSRSKSYSSAKKGL